MSKTYDNCIWLEDSAKDMYGKTLRIEDRLITTLHGVLLDIPMERSRIGNNKKENPMTFKKQLAQEIVRMYHTGRSCKRRLRAEFTKVFTDKEMPSDIPEVKRQKRGAPSGSSAARN